MKNLKENIQKNNMKILAISAVLGMFCYCANNAAENNEEEEEGNPEEEEGNPEEEEGNPEEEEGNPEEEEGNPEEGNPEEEEENPEEEEENPEEEEENPEEEEITDIKKVLSTMLFGQINIEIAIDKILLDTRKKIYHKIKEEGTVIKKKVSDFIQEQIVSEGKNDAMLQNDMKILKQYFHLEEIKKDNDECNEGNLTEIFWEKGEEKDNGEMVGNEEEKIKGYFQTIIETEKAISKAFQEYYVQ